MSNQVPLFQGAVCLQLGSYPAVSIAAKEVVATKSSEAPVLIGTAGRLRETLDALVSSRRPQWVCEARSWPELSSLLAGEFSRSYEKNSVFFLWTRSLVDELNEANLKHLEQARDLLSALAVRTNWVEESSDDVRRAAAVAFVSDASARPSPAASPVRVTRRQFYRGDDRSDDAKPGASALEQARRRREQILQDEHFLSAREVHAAQGGEPDATGAANTASRLRRNGELLGVWTGREYRYPSFQFHPSSGRAMVDDVKALLKVLPADPSGWRQAAWLFQGHARLEGRRPADAFAERPEFVLEIARDTFTNPDAQW